MTTEPQSADPAAPAVSVIMTVYDGVKEHELEEACQSILDQTYTDFEFVIMSDGIRRASLMAVLERFAAKDSRVRLLINPDNMGIAHGLNRCIEQSRGRYIARMDADDLSLPTRLARQIECLEADPALMFLGTYLHEIGPDGQVLFEKRMPVEARKVQTQMSFRDPFNHPTIIFRREFFDRCGLYSEAPEYSYLEDTELYSRALLNGCSASTLPEVLYLFRVSPGFYRRRRGMGFVVNEMRLRLNFIRAARLPAYRLALPFAVAMMRLSPATVTHMAYKWLRA